MVTMSSVFRCVADICIFDGTCLYQFPARDDQIHTIAALAPWTPSSVVGIFSFLPVAMAENIDGSQAIFALWIQEFVVEVGSIRDVLDRRGSEVGMPVDPSRCDVHVA